MLLFITTYIGASFRTTLNKTDPNPFYNTIFPFEILFDWEKDYLHNRICCENNQHFYVAASPFFQFANKGTDINGNLAELGDLTGRWNMIAVLPYATIDDLSADPTAPADSTICQSVMTTTLQRIADNTLECIKAIFIDANGNPLTYPDQLKSIAGLLELQNQVELLGYFSVPIKFKKKGIRFQAGGILGGGFGASFDIGVSNVSQVAKFIDLTSATTCTTTELCLASCPTATNPLIYCLNPFSTASVSNEQWKQVVRCINRNIMDNLQEIAQATNLNLCNYDKTSLEDIHVELFWRNAFCMNNGRSRDWPRFLLVPFFIAGATFATGQEADPDMAFSVPSGNNGHNEGDFLAGIGVDFQDTIEVGVEAGFVHFRPKCYNCYRMPNNPYQKTIFPYQTQILLKPGNTWHVGVFMTARNFLDHWSFWGQYAYITHNKDTVCIQKPDTNWQPQLIECRSDWNVQVFNGALNYEIAPGMSLGVFAQIPLARFNAYRESQFLGNLFLAF